MNSIQRASLVLASGVLIAVVSLMVVSQLTQSRIADNVQRINTESLNAILPTGPYDNHPLELAHWVTAAALAPNQAVKIYPIYKNRKPYAAAITVVAPDGYNGAIQLLLGITENGTVSGVRVITHKETPGLGDDIEIKRSTWINDFTSKSLANTQTSLWDVKKEGGSFDAFTGATITPRSVIHAIQRALTWYSQHSDQVFIHEHE